MNNKIVFLVALVIAVSVAAPQDPPAKELSGQPYSFDYSVKDEESKNDYGHKESSDGKVVTGSYRLLLPDSRTQIVTYTADQNGYVANVKYEGLPEPSQ